MPAPIFLADISHIIECIAKPLLALAMLSTRLSIYTKSDTLRIQRNFGWYFQQNRYSETCTFEELVVNTNAPVAYHCNIHICCNASWCWMILQKKVQLMRYQKQINYQVKTKIKKEIVQNYQLYILSII